MIRLRDILEGGRAHPILGPILLVVLVFLLAMVFLHVAAEGMDAATEVGAICVGIATALGLLVTNRPRRGRVHELITVPGDRGPPRLPDTYSGTPTRNAARLLSLPLRR